MAYNGYLIKVGDYTIPLSMMRAETYKVSKKILDIDSYRDANGELHREALDHFSAVVTFNIPPLKTNKEISAFLSNIQNNYTIPKERKASVEFYMPETDNYVTLDMYMPDIEFTMYMATKEFIKYNETPIEFIGY
jgi:hypothetical protein